MYPYILRMAAKRKLHLLKTYKTYCDTTTKKMDAHIVKMKKNMEHKKTERLWTDELEVRMRRLELLLQYIFLDIHTFIEQCKPTYAFTKVDFENNLLADASLSVYDVYRYVRTIHWNTETGRLQRTKLLNSVD